MKEMVNLNFRWFMQTLLDRKDRMSMYSGLEVRVPFCDYRIAEYLYTVPWAYKDWQGREKGLLRQAVAGLLPEPVRLRKKSPFPKTYDPGYESFLIAALQKVLADSSSPLLSLVDSKKLSAFCVPNCMNWNWKNSSLQKQKQEEARSEPVIVPKKSVPITSHRAA